MQADLAAYLGFSADELIGRSLGVLRGPNSDAVALNGAIKSATLSNKTQLPIAFYDRDGNVHQFEAAMSAEFSSEGTAAGCCISLRSVDNATSAPSASDTANSAKVHPISRNIRASSRRGPHNRHVGELLQAEATAGSPSPAAMRKEDAIFNLLLGGVVAAA